MSCAPGTSFDFINKRCDYPNVATCFPPLGIQIPFFNSLTNNKITTKSISTAKPKQPITVKQQKIFAALFK